MVNWFSATKLGHHFLTEVLQPGDTAVDGTMGNGHDTLMLAKAVSPGGKVLAFDIQQQALEKTRLRLAGEGFREQVQLIQDGHQNLDKYLFGMIKGAILNLGYLPGGDHGIITRVETTLQAVQHILNFLQPGGRLVIVVYPGHPGGKEEKEAVEAFVGGLASDSFNVLRINLFNRPATAPGVLLIEKAGEGA